MVKMTLPAVLVLIETKDFLHL